MKQGKKVARPKAEPRVKLSLTLDELDAFVEDRVQAYSARLRERERALAEAGLRERQEHIMTTPSMPANGWTPVPAQPLGAFGSPIPPLPAKPPNPADDRSKAVSNAIQRWHDGRSRLFSAIDVARSCDPVHPSSQPVMDELAFLAENLVVRARELIAACAASGEESMPHAAGNVPR